MFLVPHFEDEDTKSELNTEEYEKYNQQMAR